MRPIASPVRIALLSLTSPSLGDGGHTHEHAGALPPDSLRWLWRGYPKR